MISKWELYAELDMIEREQKKVIVFGLKELEGKNECSEQDKRGVLDLFQDIGADGGQLLLSGVSSCREDPVCMQSPEDRSAILNLAKQLKNQQKWNKVYLAENFRKNQYMLDNFRETSLKEQVTRRNQQLNNQGIKWKVVGGRGARRIVIVRTD
jgi:hypothetical protein